MSIFKTLPLDIVNQILLYDRRYAMHNGKITIVKKLDPNKYETIINLLLQKPPICEIELWSFGGGFWKSCSVEFTKNPANYFSYRIEYSIGYLDQNTILYGFWVNKGDSTARLARLNIK
jgi:hypothetical protein